LTLVSQYDAIYHEKLQPANMVRNHHLAKSNSDAGWGAFLTILAYTAACAGRRVVAVNPAYTSQMCRRVWQDGLQGPVCPLALVPSMRNSAPSGPQRRQEQGTGRAGASGRRGVGRVREPSIPWLSPWGVSSHEILLAEHFNPVA
jgi:putative transposase